MICSGKDITINFGGDPVLEKVTFEAYAGDRVGIVGRNGSGKTTLLSILAGKETPDHGQVHWKKGCRVGWLAQLPEFAEDMTVYEVMETAFAELNDIEQQMKRLEREMSTATDEKELTRMAGEYGNLQEQFERNGGYGKEAEIEGAARGLQLYHLLKQPFQSLSGGEKTKAGLAVLLLGKPDLLLLDEPTNHLDLSAIEWLQAFLTDYPGTVLTVSHDRYFLDETVTKVFDLENGELTVYHGNYSSFTEEKEKYLLLEFQKYEEQQKKIKKMKEAIKRLKEWANQANPPNEALHKRARNMERALERMEKIDRPVLENKRIGFALDAGGRSGTDVLLAEGISKSYGEKQLFEGVDLHLRFQERLVLMGDNGSGKSTLLRILLGQETPDYGKVKTGSRVKIGYLAQHLLESEEENMSVLDAFREEVAVTEGEARHILARFLFYGYAVFKKLGQMSGGERMRLRLAQFMHQDLNVLVLDEPTNHLDIESLEVVEEALSGYTGTILAVSHDRYFINKVFNRVAWLNDGRLHHFTGTYEEVKHRMKREESRIEPPEAHEAEKEEQKPLKNSRKIQGKTAAQLETELTETEERIESLDRLLYETGDPKELEKLYREKEQIGEKREKLYDELAMLEEETG
ncbi:ribosomal protection-like ABC-F family protein [Alteribacter natronophilus]|uniref:ribosomal protection-like ABC-F family protein n=1 Tax=Alteribacter natronophilus TaxID=2583810 RepID=UPI00110F022A|nr:ABC-F type ribosomal protection protein [Alteribacter natronophilus]TMW70862.1 ABC-F type ribosomal protection protein [Alteribacter natronophilus]